MLKEHRLQRKSVFNESFGQVTILDANSDDVDGDEFL